MANQKRKWWYNIFNNSSKNQDHKVKAADNVENKQHYFSNVAPPVSNSETYKEQNINELMQFKKANFCSDELSNSANSSYIITLKNQPQANLATVGDRNINQLHNSSLPFVANAVSVTEKLKADFKIPRPLRYEIKIVKWRQLLFCFAAFLVTIFSSIFIILYFSNINYKKPHFLFFVPLLIFSFMIFIVNLYEYIGLQREINLYVKKAVSVTATTFVPNFIVRNYRKMHGSLIIFNWLFGVSYISLGLVVLFMFLVSQQKITFLVEPLSTTFPNLMKEIIILGIVVLVLFISHVINLILFKIRKTNILSYYGYEIILQSELDSYKKKINRICMIITITFVIIIFFVVAIPILIIRRRRRKN